MTEDTLIGLKTLVMISDSFSHWSSIPSDFQIQLCKFVAVPMCTPLCKFSIIINADLHWKVFVTDRLVPGNNLLLSHLPENIVSFGHC